MDNDEIWIGESADCGSNMVLIGKGKDAVPIVLGCEAEVAPEPTTTQSIHGTGRKALLSPLKKSALRRCRKGVEAEA
jgi:hypothetical protein